MHLHRVELEPLTEVMHETEVTNDLAFTLQKIGT